MENSDEWSGTHAGCRTEPCSHGNVYVGLSILSWRAGMRGCSTPRMLTHNWCAKPGNQCCPHEDNHWEKPDYIINSWLGENGRQPCQQPELAGSWSRRSAEPTICRARRRGNVPTPDLYFLKGLIKSNQFTSLHTLSSSSRSKTKGGRERRRTRQASSAPS